MKYKVKRSTITILYTLLCTFIAIFTMAVKAQSNNYHQQILQQATNFLSTKYSSELPLAQTNIKLRPIKSNLNLSPCKQPIAFKHTANRTSRINIKAQCSSPFWSIFLTGNIEQWLAIAHSTKPLNKGTILGPKHITLVNTDIRKTSKAYFTDSSELFGRQLKRSIRAGQIIDITALTKHYLVRKGDMVVIEAKNGNAIIRMSGIALENGQQGKQINIRNSRSGRVIRAYVDRVGVVSVVR